MNLGRLASGALMLSGIAGVAMPDRVAEAMSLTPRDGRGKAETRAGLGGTYAALGGWAFVTDSPAARTAVGMTWLGAAATRLGTRQLDTPEADATYWAFLGAEVGFGLAGVLSGAGGAVSRKRAAKSDD
jgi:hypothetical protein